MRLFRPVSAAVASTVIAAAAFTGPATAAVPGVGTSLTSTKLLTAQLGENGSVLDLLVLGDEARSTIDSAVASPEAFTRLTAVSAKTSLVPSLNQTVGVYEAKSSGPTSADVVPQTIVPVALPAALGPVLSGSLGAGKLTAVLDNGIASSALNVGVTDLNAVGGLLGLKSLTSTLGASSAPDVSGATRGAAIKDLTVLDLGALLNGLGISLADLDIAQLTALVDTLNAATGLTLPTGTTTLAGAVASVQQAIDQVQATVTTTTGGAVTSVDSIAGPAVQTLVSTVGVSAPLPSVTGTATTVINQAQAVIDGLQAQLDKLVADALKTLDGLALLRLEGVEVGVTTKAVDSVEGSVADVTGKIGKVRVGNVELPGIDLLAATSTVNAAVATVNSTIGKALGAVSPDLANLVDISVLDKTTSVTESGGYVRSLAGITGASATITPPAALAALVSTITSQTDAVKSVLPASTVSSLGLSGAMNQLAGVLNITNALKAPAKVKLATVVASSEFARGSVAGPVSTPENTLPRTGSPAGLALLGGLAAVLALVLRRALKAPELRAVHVDTK